MNVIRPVEALRHPLWWSMLAVLLCNDLWWKHAGVLPGVLTGKLSDFSGLMVFPLFVALLFGVNRRGWWTAIHVASGLAFAAIKLVPAAGVGLVQLFSVFGVRWQIWFDATDVLALLVLPVSWYVYPRLRPLFSLPRFGSVLRVGAVLVAGFACVATGAVPAPRTLSSHDGNYMVSDLTFINATSGNVNVQIERLNPHIEVDCHAPVRAEDFRDDQFKSQGTWTQAPGEATTLLPLSVRKEADGRCKVVKLTVDTAESVLVVWSDAQLPIRDVPIRYGLPLTADNAPENTLILHRQEKNYFFVAKGDFTLTYWRQDRFGVDYWRE
ncbi:MAG: hypothetical protein FWC40_08425 [Proteobacteria bacterium]|nr:hypothetical protein [Pseudomonadota bacterium]